MKEQKNLSVQRWAYSLDEAAEMLGVSKGHLRNENKRGKLKFIKSSRRTLVGSEELQKYIEEQTEHRQLTIED
jgi:excisionase family DNA binding protein